MTVTLVDLVVQHLLKYRKITSVEAFNLYGITRLSAIIASLRGKGYPIETEFVEGVNRYGNPTRYGVYTVPKNWKPERAKK